MLNLNDIITHIHRLKILKTIKTYLKVQDSTISIVVISVLTESRNKQEPQQLKTVEI